MAAMMRSATASGCAAAAVVLEQHGELVAAEARRGVRRARALGAGAAATARRSSSPAACPSAVVDGLEAVEVDEEHAQLGLAAGRHVERVLQAVEEERAVGQPGERVVEGLLHGLDGARVGQREARVLGEGVEHAELGVVEAARARSPRARRRGRR